MKKVFMVAAVMAVLSGGVHAATLVTVNGEKIDSAVIDAQVQLITQKSNGQIQDSQQLRNGLLERMAGQTVVVQEAKRLKLDQTSAYKDALKQARAAAKEQGADKQPTFKQEFAQYERDLLNQAYAIYVIEQNPVAAAEVQAFYTDFQKKYQGSEEVKLSEIFLSTEADAKAVVADLKKGQKFADVAKAKSLDPRAKQSGGENPNYVNLKDMQQNAPAVYAVISNLKKGQYSQPVNAQNVWGVFKLEDKRAANIPAFETVQANIVNQLRNERVNAATGQLFQKAKIEQ
ncbi:MULTISPECIES: peptidylprolyl isomerase [Vitreoscilla]|uniref:peptidylprolyl isomerase n=1 Tax=Vitreoscilla stercoraria TaxID=61 RepID=A0ABY4E899_VITST|nr:MULTISPECIES: peptidyl-prolyl cis-trans isomerase [Vitreoscilla]AUZ04265.2 putative PpiC-type peptidyl-prolyl cis-trans isomerase [Vitreoscilla sp. C1]UOO91989.1 peptidyl-prolyl cis-trans isomerase [Vitreoscilla stercoraria]